MTKRKKSPARARSDGLENPYPSAPKFPAKYVIYYYPIDKNGKRCGVQTWCTLYAAKRVVDLLINEREFSWVTRNEIDVDGMSIKCDELEDIVEYEYANEREAAWLPGPTEFDDIRRAIGEVVVHDVEDTVKAVRAKKPRGERKPRASREGMVSAGDIAAELGVQARDVRVVLRSLKLTKPDAGWAWPKDEADKIKEQIKKGLK